MIQDPRVLGAATDVDLVEKMRSFGIVFPKGEPGSGIVGASGLLLGMGKLKGIDSACLMGETSGYFADPKAAQAVLEILSKILDVPMDFAKLEEKAEEINGVATKLKELENISSVPESDDLTYIG